MLIKQLIKVAAFQFVLHASVLSVRYRADRGLTGSTLPLPVSELAHIILLGVFRTICDNLLCSCERVDLPRLDLPRRDAALEE